ncbi:MAG: type II secretion system protein N [Moraxellaceae bacterium]|nr:type II secretion system protein N [Moraxellaceae bacterium]MDP1775761.1 type II secretion system protein N [Moraxellaceae bacterium]
MTERLQRFIQQARSERTANIIFLLSLIVLAWLLGRMLWLLVQGPTTVLPMPSNMGVTSVDVRVQPEQIAAVFGDQQTVVQAEPENTTLQLRLTGVIESSEPTHARAFISERSAGQVESFKTGDKVPGGATLDQVYADRVVLLRGGREEILRFDELPATAQAPVAPDRAAQNAAQTRAALSQMAEQLANSPLAAMRQMGLRRTSRGYVVSVTAPKEMMQRFGLQPGDRIVSINGQTVGQDLDADQQVMSQLQQEGNARVEVQRGAQTITLEQKL